MTCSRLALSWADFRLAIPPETLSGSRRVRARVSFERAVVLVYNRVLWALSELSLPGVGVFPSFSSRFNTPDQRLLSFFDRRCLSGLLGRCRDYVRRRGASGSLGAAAFLQDLQSTVREPASSAAGYGVGAARVRLKAAAVAMPAAAGGVDLLAHLSPDLRARYSQPDGLVLGPEASAPAVRSRGVPQEQRGEYVELLRRMRAAGMVGVTADPACENGVFAVAKDGGRQRLIIDCRPCNSLMVPSPHVSLPTPDLLASLEVPAASTLFTAKLDCSDYFHQFRVPAWMTRYFALPAVRASELGLSVADGYHPDQLVNPCCLTLPMGWSHSVLLAQAVQETLLLRNFGREQLILPGNSADVSGLRVGCYIDDIFFFDVDAQRCQRAADLHESELGRARLPVPAAKRLPATAEPTSVIGVEINGRTHRFGLAAPKLGALCGATEALLARRRVGREAFDRLLGLWTWAVLPCRPAFAALQAVYGFQQRLAAESGQQQLWRTARRELQVLIGLAPILDVQLSAAWSPHVLATDASSSGFGASLGRAAVGTVRHLGRTAGTQSLPTADTVAGLREAGLGPLRRVRWRHVISAPWGRSEHVNVLECRSLTYAVRYAIGNRRLQGQRLLALVDSTVVVAAGSKGRSSSFALLRPLRQLAAVCLLSRVRLYLRWVATASNPADLPSRAFSPLSNGPVRV